MAVAWLTEQPLQQGTLAPAAVLWSCVAAHLPSADTLSIFVSTAGNVARVAAEDSDAPFEAELLELVQSMAAHVTPGVLQAALAVDADRFQALAQVLDAPAPAGNRSEGHAASRVRCSSCHLLVGWLCLRCDAQEVCKLLARQSALQAAGGVANMHQASLSKAHDVHNSVLACRQHILRLLAASWQALTAPQQHTAAAQLVAAASQSSDAACRTLAVELLSDLQLNAEHLLPLLAPAPGSADAHAASDNATGSKQRKRSRQSESDTAAHGSAALTAAALHRALPALEVLQWKHTVSQPALLVGPLQGLLRSCTLALGAADSSSGSSAAANDAEAPSMAQVARACQLALNALKHLVGTVDAGVSQQLYC